MTIRLTEEERVKLVAASQAVARSMSDTVRLLVLGALARARGEMD